MLYTTKNYNLFNVGKNRICNNAVLPTLFMVVNNIVQHCWAWISPQSGVTMLSNIVDSYYQCEQHNIVVSCFYQPVYDSTFNLFCFDLYCTNMQYEIPEAQECQVH